MRLGIDFGTTRVVVAAVDRGNYPVVSFDCPDGTVRDWYPPLIAVEEGVRSYGWDAWAAQGRPGVTLIRSIKRVLPDAGPESLIALGSEGVPLLTLLVEMAQSLRSQLHTRSNLDLAPGEPLEVLLGVPANANSNQRFLTAEAFRAAGFDVLGLLNEPSAASIEFSHRQSDSGAKSSDLILVYDLGGGTFDVSLMERSEREHVVVATESIATLGGDDFDELLAELALELAGHASERLELTAVEEFLLLEECRQKKEALHPNTRRLVIDLDIAREGWGQIAVPVADFYERCQALVDETLHAAEDLLTRTHEASPVSLYVTGGGSELPLVSRLLRERFGKRVKRSAYTRAATAIGLAIQADAQSGYRLRERFTRWFGVWREADAGRHIQFDALFERGAALPGPGEPPLEQTRRYAPVHNIGHFRYLECSRRNQAGEPVGDLTAWDDIRFPFDPQLATLARFDNVPVSHSALAEGQIIEEKYQVDASGSVHVTISNLTGKYSRTYRLGRWAVPEATITPQKTRGRRKKASA